ncbi:MAG: GNAT family N-acetyltransferase [Candidatus Pacebacteria bacterium]|nr:GNAT family N-acetyltransferase [Candidatus Paceibacterota bacterium]
MKKKTPVIFLQGKRLYLRPLDLSDLSLVQRFVNDPDVRKYLSSTYPLSKGDEEEWIKRVSSRNPNNIVLAVVLKKDNKFLGTMGLHRIDYVSGIACTGSMLGAKEEWNKGYAREAKMLLLEYAFMTLNLRKICSDAFAKNKGSIKHNQNCGYKVEGVLKRHHYRDGKYHDQVLLSVFKRDWLKLRK